MLKTLNEQTLNVIFRYILDQLASRFCIQNIQAKRRENFPTEQHRKAPPPQIIQRDIQGNTKDRNDCLLIQIYPCLFKQCYLSLPSYYHFQKSVENKKSSTSSKKNDIVESSSGWDDWGATSNNVNNDDWSTGDSKSGDGWGESDVTGNGDGWDDGWPANDEEDEEKKRKEQRKQELLKKREERRAQRELNNKAKPEFIFIEFKLIG